MYVSLEVDSLDLNLSLEISVANDKSYIPSNGQAGLRVGEDVYPSSANLK